MVKLPSLKLERDKKTPHVFFDTESQKIRIEGNSIAENPFTFYERIYEYIDSLIQKKGSLPFSSANMRFFYINTPSLKCILELLQRLVRSRPDLDIVWEFDTDDEDMQEIGEMFAKMLNIEIKTQAIPA
jgi:hypothetical protein